MIQLIDNIYGVEVKPGFDWYWLSSGFIMADSKNGVTWGKQIPKGRFIEIGLGSEVKEETAAGIVERMYAEDGQPGYVLYWDDNRQHLSPTATASLHSLIKSKGMEPETCFLIRKIA